MNQEALIRNFIRKKLAEEYNLGTQMEDESDFDLSTFDDAISMLDMRKKTQDARLNAMKKQFGIPSHPDGEINRMMKRTAQAQMDDIEDDIDNIGDQEEELEKAKGEFERMDQQNKEMKKKMSQVQSQTTTDTDITNT